MAPPRSRSDTPRACARSPAGPPARPLPVRGRLLRTDPFGEARSQAGSDDRSEHTTVPYSCRSGATGPAGSTPSASPGACTDWVDVPCRAVAAPEQDQSFVDRISRQGEEALGKIAEELISNPVINGAIARAFEAREKAVQAQEAAMGALNIPSAADIERVTRRLRSCRSGSRGSRTPSTGSRSASRARRLARRRPARPDRGPARRDRARHRRARRAARAGTDPMPRAQERLTVTGLRRRARVAGLAHADAQLGQLVVGHPPAPRRSARRSRRARTPPPPRGGRPPGGRSRPPSPRPRRRARPTPRPLPRAGRRRGRSWPPSPGRAPASTSRVEQAGVRLERAVRAERRARAVGRQHRLGGEQRAELDRRIERSAGPDPDQRPRAQRDQLLAHDRRARPAHAGGLHREQLAVRRGAGVAP